MDVVDQLAAQVRERLRELGTDPVAEPAALRRVAEQLLADRERERPASPLPAGDPAAVVSQVVARVAGLGPLQPYLDDPEVEELWINEPGKVFVARRGRSELTPTVLTAATVRELVERMLASSGRRVDRSTPFVDAALPDGSRLHVVIPDVTRRHWAVNVRRFVAPARRLSDLVELGTLTRPAAALLSSVVAAGLTVLVSGGTQAGKTTLLNCLAAAVPARARVVTAEEVFELRVPVRDVVGMQCRQPSLEGTGEVTLRRLVREALRMRPDRIVVGEVRGAECLDLLLALSCGVPGMATIHADDARGALARMCTLPLLAGENVGGGFVVPTVAAAIDLVVHVAVAGDGRRRVAEVAAVSGRVVGGAVETTTLLRRDAAGRLDPVLRGGRPPRVERLVRSGVDVAALLAG